MTNPHPILLWLGCFVVSIVPALILAAILVRRRRRNRRSLLDMALWGLLIPLALYPLGCQTWIVGSMVRETVAARPATVLLAKLHKGMTRAQVEAVMGRPDETRPYGLGLGPDNFVQHWNIGDNRAGVHFVDGRLEEWWNWPHREYDTFFHRLFLWWAPELD